MLVNIGYCKLKTRYSNRYHIKHKSIALYLRLSPLRPINIGSDGGCSQIYLRKTSYNSAYNLHWYGRDEVSLRIKINLRSFGL
jgi:hypothetical protein